MLFLCFLYFCINAAPNQNTWREKDSLFFLDLLKYWPKHLTYRFYVSFRSLHVDNHDVSLDWELHLPGAVWKTSTTCRVFFGIQENELVKRISYGRQGSIRPISLALTAFWFFWVWVFNLPLTQACLIHLTIPVLLYAYAPIRITKYMLRRSPALSGKLRVLGLLKLTNTLVNIEVKW